jgi:RimJ/RimL family protein N-acetyltransferase
MSTEQATAPTGPVALEGIRTRLREFAMSDLDAVHALVGDDRVTSFLSFDSRSRDKAQTMLVGMVERAQIRPRSEYYLAITPRDADHVVGFARLAFSGVQAAKLGYAVAYDRQRKGYASDAVATMLDFAFGPLALHRVTAAVGPRNSPLR